MKLLIDMNLSPLLVADFHKDGWEAVHWSTVGNPRAPDHTIMDWARQKDYVVITNDLDFSDILAATSGKCPSVIQVRTQDLSPDRIYPMILTVLEQYKTYLEEGALISVNEARSRLRILPI